MRFLLYILSSRIKAVWHTGHIYNLLTPEYIKSLNKKVFVKNIDYIPGNDWSIEIEEIEIEWDLPYENIDGAHFYKNPMHVYLVFENEIDATLYKLFLDK